MNHRFRDAFLVLTVKAGPHIDRVGPPPRRRPPSLLDSPAVVIVLFCIPLQVAALRVFSSHLDTSRPTIESYRSSVTSFGHCLWGLLAYGASIECVRLRTATLSR